MNTLQISDYVFKHQKRNFFHGVYPCDALPSIISLPFLAIVNLSCRNESGTHWIGIFIDNNRNGYYFDSFAIQPRNKFIITFLKSHAKRFAYNVRQIQHISSKKCGQFCCGFAISLLKNVSIHDFLNKFGSNLFVNDLIIENMMRYFK